VLPCSVANPPLYFSALPRTRECSVGTLIRAHFNVLVSRVHTLSAHLTPAVLFCPTSPPPRSRDFEYEAFRFESECMEVIEALQKKKVRITEGRQ
jgi:hypothetical protein